MKTSIIRIVALMPLLLTGCTAARTPYNVPETLALVIIVMIVGLFISLALFSNILREEVNDCDAFNQNKIKLLRSKRLRYIKSSNKFSLSSVQLAIWTVIISSSYVYLALCKTHCETADFNQTALLLLGIGAGVSTSGTLIDKREIQTNIARHQNAPSQGFFTDLLSDGDGISIHRFQNVVWVFIAMTIYLYKIFTDPSCSLPELSNTLLTLTGISSATYLVIRSQENALSPNDDDIADAPAPSPSSGSPSLNGNNNETGI